jgi:hypothetical protein
MSNVKAPNEFYFDAFNERYSKNSFSEDSMTGVKINAKNYFPKGGKCDYSRSTEHRVV